MLELDNGDLIGLEVKASSSIDTRDFNGLSKLAEFAGDRFLRGYLLYSGTEILPFKKGEKEFYALPIGVLGGGNRED